MLCLCSARPLSSRNLPDVRILLQPIQHRVSVRGATLSSRSSPIRPRSASSPRIPAPAPWRRRGQRHPQHRRSVVHDPGSCVTSCPIRLIIDSALQVLRVAVAAVQDVPICVVTTATVRPSNVSPACASRTTSRRPTSARSSAAPSDASAGPTRPPRPPWAAPPDQLPHERRDLVHRDLDRHVRGDRYLPVHREPVRRVLARQPHRVLAPLTVRALFSISSHGGPAPAWYTAGRASPPAMGTPTARWCEVQPAHLGAVPAVQLSLGQLAWVYSRSKMRSSTMTLRHAHDPRLASPPPPGSRPGPSTVILSGECSRMKRIAQRRVPDPRSPAASPLITSSVLRQSPCPADQGRPLVSSFMFDAGVNGSLARMSQRPPVSRSSTLTPTFAPPSL